MIYGSVCSGIESASVAWHPLGWRAAFLAEIEKFPSAVLAHHYGSNMPGEAYSRNGTPNYGDITKFQEWPDAAIDVLVGGTPCQSFSIAGLRKGMADPRGNLALTYLGIVDRYRPKWFVWENVPGVLSSNGGRDFGSFLGGVQQLGYGFAYRVLDAQFVRVDGFGRAVPQRRRRVFVVGSARGWRSAAAVLFERESLRWDSAPSREAGERPAPTISARTKGGGGLGTDFDCDGGLIPEVCGTLSDGAHMGGGLNGQDAYTGRIIPTVAHALRADGFDASEDGTGRGTPLVPIAFSAKDHGADAAVNVSQTLRAGGFTNSHANAGVMPAIAFNARQDPLSKHDCALPLDTDPTSQAVAFDLVQITSKTNRSRAEVGLPAPTMSKASDMHVAQAFSITPSNSNKDYNARATDKAQALTSTGNRPSARGGDFIAETWAVRRLTPKECERLQGFPDGYTDIPWRGKDNSPDGPRYKAIGNSKAVNVVRWIGKRIQMVEDLIVEGANG